MAKPGTRPGMLEKKQNVFDDFIAVAEYLVKEKYTSPAKLGDPRRIERRPAGRRRDGAATGPVRRGASRSRRDGHAAVRPVHRRPAWVTEYGSSSNPEQFAFLIKYSPVHNLKAGHVLPRDARHHGRSRRPRGAEPFVQVRGRAAGGAGLRQARPDPCRDAAARTATGRPTSSSRSAPISGRSRRRTWG